MKEGRWLLLFHQLPPKPDYFRVKIWRRLQGLGAVAIKNSVYALPFSPQASEDFQWLRKEIVAGGGEAAVCRATFVDGLADPQIEALFQTAHTLKGAISNFDVPHAIAVSVQLERAGKVADFETANELLPELEAAIHQLEERIEAALG